jgi:hypothetical protein
MRSSTVLSLPLQLGFLDQIYSFLVMNKKIYYFYSRKPFKVFPVVDINQYLILKLYSNNHKNFSSDYKPGKRAT